MPKDNPIKPLRLAAVALADEINKMVPDKAAIQKALDDLSAEAHKCGLLVRIEVGE